MNLERQVRQCNELLARELGPNPLHGWKHSGELHYFALARDDEGKPKATLYCGCGVDKMIHEPHCKTLSVARYTPERMEMYPQFPNRWIFCRLFPPPSREEWSSIYGTEVNYPPNGLWMGLSNGITGVIRLPPGAEPSLELTEIVIRGVKDFRAQRLRDLEIDTEFQQDRKRWKTREQHRSQLKDRMTSRWGNLRPGTRGGDTSFPQILRTV